MILRGAFPPQPNAADWSESIEILDAETGTPFDLSNALIEIEVLDQRGCRQFLGSTTAGEITLIEVGFEFAFPASTMRNLCAGSYTVNIRITDNATGSIAEPIIAQLPVIYGGYR